MGVFYIFSLYFSLEVCNSDKEEEQDTGGSRTENKRVEFRERQELREINPDGTFTDVPAGQYLNSTYVRPNSPQNSIQTTLTDSRAIRETEIRFLNEPTSPISLNGTSRPGIMRRVFIGRR
jgi:hypothetical protein